METDVADVACFGQEVRDDRRRIRSRSVHKEVAIAGAQVDDIAQARRDDGREENVPL
jgi:hypothetical protein